MKGKPILEVENLTKKFGEATPVNNVSLHIDEKEIYGFLGPNGAGKSTTMKMLLGILKSTNGEIEIFGENLKSNKTNILKNIGALIEEPSYYSNLTGKENLKIIQDLLNLPESNVEEALEIVRLTKHKDKLVKNYSLGMKQRLGIALAIVKFPRFLILDEPTNGLDPSGIQEIRELIKSFPKKYGMTVLISSHLLSEIESMATKVGIISEGEMLFEGNLSELESENKILIDTNNNNKAKELLSIYGYDLEENEQPILIRPKKERIAAAIELLVKSKLDIYKAEPIKKTLEQTFLEMTTNGKEVL
ncbi:ABC transporter ATP-binding protein [Staphylococcus pettenkoferi]|uniref:ABC transporter ATP-binding protein n=1 Tax=Staphylococcus pettenkoferi TaxID=170573 RepID=UPI001F560013|nr:ATP-binding cassette domain-containing protein [Staphylococcus pettenkoferi]MCI2803731.1 ATP-binding cassette domain-containing protein [Staphylococcus pettenkoferi]